MPSTPNPDAAIVDQAVAAAASTAAAARVARWGSPDAAWLAEAERRYAATNPGAFNEQTAETALERCQRDV